MSDSSDLYPLNQSRPPTTASPSSDDDDDDSIPVVTYNSNHMYIWILAVTFVIAIIVGGYYSSKFSTLLRKHSFGKGHQRKLCKRINDISVCNWFFLTIPVLNIGLAGGLGHNVEMLAKSCK